MSRVQKQPLGHTWDEGENGVCPARGRSSWLCCWTRAEFHWITSLPPLPSTASNPDSVSNVGPHQAMRPLPGSSQTHCYFIRASCSQLFINVFQPLTREKSQLPYTQFRICLLFRILMWRPDKRGLRPPQLVNPRSEDLKTKKHKHSHARRGGAVPAPVT